MKLYCATSNPGKLREFLLAAERIGAKASAKRGVAPAAWEFIPAEGIPPCPESGSTFEENAVEKAVYYGSHLPILSQDRSIPPDQLLSPSSRTGAIETDSEAAFLFAEDSGLEVDALSGRPGVYSARYANLDSGINSDDEANNRKLITELAGVPDELRSARYVCAIALVDRGRLLGTFRGVVEGLIVDDPRGGNGFGYDPHFFYPPFGCTFGEASAERKLAVSHRGRAVEAMLQYLAERAPCA